MTLAGLRPGEKLYEEKLMAEEGLKKTKTKSFLAVALENINTMIALYIIIHYTFNETWEMPHIIWRICKAFKELSIYTILLLQTGTILCMKVIVHYLKINNRSELICYSKLLAEVAKVEDLSCFLED